MDSLDALAITSSVPYRSRLTGAGLRAKLESGDVPDEFRPHIERALTEAPIEMLARLVFEAPSGEGRRAIEMIGKLAAEFGASERIAAWMIG